MGVREMESASDDSISSLTRRLRRSEEAAFREFHDLYFARLFRYLIVVTRGDEHDAAEALQQTMLRVVRHVRVFNSEEVFWSWLTVLARSSARDLARKQRRYKGFLDRLFKRSWRDAPECPESSFDGQDSLLTKLESALPTLPTADAELIEQKYFLRLSVREMAASLGTTEKAVESRLARIRHRLRNTILKTIDHE